MDTASRLADFEKNRAKPDLIKALKGQPSLPRGIELGFVFGGLNGQRVETNHHCLACNPAELPHRIKPAVWPGIGLYRLKAADEIEVSVLVKLVLATIFASL